MVAFLLEYVLFRPFFLFWQACIFAMAPVKSRESVWLQRGIVLLLVVALLLMAGGTLASGWLNSWVALFGFWVGGVVLIEIAGALGLALEVCYTVDRLESPRRTEQCSVRDQKTSS